MEFACGFIYVPPATNQRDGQRSSPHVIKRSALLPPINWARPRIPPPPPPTQGSPELKRPQCSSLTQKFIENIEKHEEVKKDVKPSPVYENAAFHHKGGAGVSAPAHSKLISTPQKKALLPPHMRSAANSQSPPYMEPLTSTESNGQTFIYELPKEEPDIGVQPCDPHYSYNIPEGTGGEVKLPIAPGRSKPTTQKSAPPLPPRPSFLKSVPEYLVLLPSSTTPSSSSTRTSPSAPPLDMAPTDKGPLPGNPNVILVSLGKQLLEENGQSIFVNTHHSLLKLEIREREPSNLPSNKTTSALYVLTIHGEPTSCSQCGSVLDSCYDNVVNVCYFCQSWEPTTPAAKPRCPPNGCQDGLFLLSSDDKSQSPADALLLFCIDISGSMSITSQVSVGGQMVYRTRLQFVQEAVLQCGHKLRYQQPHIRVGLITFNNQVTLHGYEEFTSRFLRGAELINSEYLKEAAFSFPSPPLLSRTWDCLQREVMGLSEGGATALGPAALLAIAMASRQPGSKVIICTDGKANTELGNLEVEDIDARTLLSSTIFYQDLGEYAASQGVTVSVLSIEGTDCRLDELGRLADRTGGKVVIASPHKLHTEFEAIIENRTIATHCSVTLLVPKTLGVRGEREAGHRGTREVGNVAPDTDITFQFGANEPDSDVSAPASGSRVSVQLQLRYRRRDGRRMLRVLTADREVTDVSSVALSSLSLAIIQLNSSQASAALAVRGRLLDARRESDLQRRLMERALEHNRCAEDKQTYKEWVKSMEPIHNGIHNYTRRNSVISDTQTLTDMGAALLYSMKHRNRKSISLKDKHKA